MRAKLNDVVVIEWDDALPEKAVVVRGEQDKTEYELFFPERRRNRTQWIGSCQIKYIVGHVKV